MQPVGNCPQCGAPIYHYMTDQPDPRDWQHRFSCPCHEWLQAAPGNEETRDEARKFRAATQEIASVRAYWIGEKRMMSNQLMAMRAALDSMAGRRDNQDLATNIPDSP